MKRRKLFNVCAHCKIKLELKSCHTRIFMGEWVASAVLDCQLVLITSVYILIRVPWLRTMAL